MATKKTKASEEPQNKPVSTATDADNITNDQEKATLPENERDGAELDVEPERLAGTGGLVMSDESDIPNQDPKAEGESPDPQMDGEDDGDVPEDPNEDAETSAQLVQAFDIRPDFFAMDEESVNRWFRAFRRQKRQSGFVVRGPRVTEYAVDAAGAAFPAGISGKQSTKRVPQGETTPLYEGFIEWQGKDEATPAVTIRCTNLDRLGALRDAAQEAMHRRLDV